MSHERTLRRVAWVVLAGLSMLAACATSPSQSAEPTGTSKVFVYRDGAGSHSRLERSVAPDGRETLHGETEIATEGRVGRVIEDATIDASGWLLHAEMSIYSRCDDQPDQRLTFDRALGLVEIHAGAKSERFRVLDDAPWVLLPSADAMGRAVTTPVSAQIALRAARVATVRLIDVDRRWTLRTPSDQLAVDTEEGVTVTLRNDGVDVRDEVVEQLRLPSVGVTLTRAFGPSGPPELACGSFVGPGVSRLQ